eukprot:scaffold142575_cov32-Tisochrysis_lutea.AAC.1
MSFKRYACMRMLTYANARPTDSVHYKERRQKLSVRDSKRSYPAGMPAAAVAAGLPRGAAYESHKQRRHDVEGIIIITITTINDAELKLSQLS